MKTLIQFKTTIPPVLVWMLLVCIGLLPKALAVVPAPDGGYPNFNTAEGTNALKNLTTGVGNAAVGWYSLFANTAGNLNTGVGAGTLLFNAGDNNTATGALALLNNTSGFYNTAIGSQTLVYNTIGFRNTATGYQALVSNTQGNFNTAIGWQALFSNTTGNANTACGSAALLSSTGFRNIALGADAGSNLTTGSDNIDIGNFGVSGESDTIRIGNMGHTATYLAGIAGQTVGAGGSTCYVDNAGKLGVFLSARRFKTDIADMGASSEALLALRPVTFHYKKEMDPQGIPQFGLVAEEVAKVNPDLVIRNAKGELSTVRYEAVNAMLLNEFIKEHKTVQEQKTIVEQLKQDFQSRLAQQQKQIETLTAGLQKVSAQLELNKLAPQTVKNNH
jgi:hypothetical protein